MKLDGMSMDLEKVNMEKLRSVFPECFSEQKLDIDKLLSLCGEYIDNDFEKYKFEWKGKSECLRLAQKRSTGTLRPCKEKSVNFDDTQNVYIEGDNLEVLKLLQTAYFNKIKMIYIDPPYNTGNDFVYEDDFADPMARYKEVTQQTTKSNPETMGRYHTNWLNMMYPRLRLAANLLTDDGVIFISIDDNEVTNLRKICDEVFGEENFVACVANTNNPKGRSDDKFVATAHEYICIYAKSINVLDWYGFEPSEEITKRYNKIDENGKKYREIDLRKTGENDLREDRPNLFYYFYYNEQTKEFYPSRQEEIPEGFMQIKPQREDGKEGNWRWGLETAEEQIADLVPKFMPTRKVWGIMQKDYLEGRSLVKPTSSWTFKDVNSERGSENFINLDFDKRIFPKPKPIGTILRCLKLCTTKDDSAIVLDFFSGSATTAHAVMQLNAEDGGNRKFICVQLPELCDEKSEAYKAGYKTICEIGEERIRRAGQKILKEFSDNAECKIHNAELKNNYELCIMNSELNLDIGFKVFKLDSSNLKLWDSTPITGDNQLEMFTERMNSMIDSIKDDRSDMDVIYEIMLKMGVPLTESVKQIRLAMHNEKCIIHNEKPVNNNSELCITNSELQKVVYAVGDFLLLIALYNDITAEDIDAMAAYAPAKIVCAEQGFKDDTALSNAHYILRDKQIELKLV